MKIIYPVYKHSFVSIYIDANLYPCLKCVQINCIHIFKIKRWLRFFFCFYNIDPYTFWRTKDTMCNNHGRKSALYFHTQTSLSWGFCKCKNDLGHFYRIKHMQFGLLNSFSNTKTLGNRCECERSLEMTIRNGCLCYSRCGAL